MKYVRSITKTTEEVKDRGDTQVGFIGIIERRNHDFGEKIRTLMKE